MEMTPAPTSSEDIRDDKIASRFSLVNNIKNCQRISGFLEIFLDEYLPFDVTINRK